MEEHCFEVPPLSRSGILTAATGLRDALRINQDYFPIGHVVESLIPKVWPDFSFEVKGFDEMGDDHGRTYPESAELWLREDVYQGVREGKGRDRFTLAHELGHLLLHQQPGMARSMKPARTVKIYQNSEWQANSFAGALLIPVATAQRYRTAEAIAEVCGVTIPAAEAQLRALRKLGLL